MNHNNPSWQRLVDAARQARDDRPVTAPYGFATRVVAIAMTNSRPSRSLFESWSWRALTVAGIFAAVTVASSYSSMTSPTADDDIASDDNVVAALLD